ncbi:hypothetical protein M9458_051356 [Cirrhinus mrigala]|uniref:Uncharacterized protein n=1 Tax=Cirrhinus mrigala TaxID=683832 RepID=A0ABD0MWJ0_CIRMR
MVETKQPPASCSWGDFMDEVSPKLPPLFLILAEEREEEEEDDDDEAIARLLEEDGEEDDDNAILPMTPSRPGSALSDGSPASAQVIPTVPACVSEMKRFWDKPFSHRVPVKGFSRLDVHNMEELGMSNPPPVELSIAHHLNPNRRAAFSSASASLPGRTEHLTASVFQKIYRSPALAVRALNATSLLTAYQAELMEEMGSQMDAGSPNPALWEEICIIADLNLRTSRGAVQSCGRSMGLAVVGREEMPGNLTGPRVPDKGTSNSTLGVSVVILPQKEQLISPPPAKRRRWTRELFIEMSKSSLLTSSAVELAPVPPVPHKEVLPPPPTVLSGKVEGSLHLPGTEEIPQVCLSGHSLRIYDCSVRALTGPTDILQMYRSGSITSENTRSQSVSLFGRSPSLLSVTAASGDGHDDARVSFGELRFQDKRDKKLPGAHAGNSLSRPQTELRSVSSVSVRGAHQVNSQLSIPFSKREESPIQTVSAPSGANGPNSLGYSFGTIANERVSELDSSTTLMSKTSSQPQSDGVGTLHARSPLLEKPLVPRVRTLLGAVSMRKVVTTDASLSGWGAVCETDGVGQKTFSFITGNARPGNNECGGRSPVQGESSVRRMDTSPSGSGPVVEEIRSERWCTYGCGCPSALMAKRTALRISSTKPDHTNSKKDVLCFLQELLDKGRAFSTVKVYLAAISACHVGIDDNTHLYAGL